MPGFLVLLFVLFIAPASAAADLRMLVSWPEHYAAVSKLAYRFAARVERETDKTLRFVFKGPDSIPPEDQLDTVALGLFDVLFTHGRFHGTTSPAGLALDAIDGDPASVREAGVWALLDSHYQALGLKLVAMPILRGGYQLLLNAPVDAACDLSAREVGAPTTFAAVVRLLDGKLSARGGQRAGIGLPRPGFTSEDSAPPYRYLMRPAFGTRGTLLLFNLDTWQKLDDDERRAILQQGVQMEVRAWKRSPQWANLEEAQMNAQGVQVTTLCRDRADRLPYAWADGVWTRVHKQDPEFADSLRSLARQAGLTR